MTNKTLTLDDIRKLHETLKNESEKTGGNTNSNNFLKLELGKNFLRVLPGKNDNLQFYSKMVKHSYQDAEGKFQTYVCRRTENETCPLCDFHWDLWKSHKSLNLPKGEKSKFGNLATQIRGKARYFMNVIDRRIEEANDGSSPVKIFATYEKIFTDLCGEITNDDWIDENDNSILSLEKGNDIVIEMSKKGDFNDFAIKTRPQKKPAGTKGQIAEWMESLHDLNALTKIGDYDAGKLIVENLKATLVESDTSSNSSNESSGEESSEEEYLNKLKS